MVPVDWKGIPSRDRPDRVACAAPCTSMRVLGSARVRSGCRRVCKFPLSGGALVSQAAYFSLVFGPASVRRCGLEARMGRAIREETIGGARVGTDRGRHDRRPYGTAQFQAFYQIGSPLESVLGCIVSLPDLRGDDQPGQGPRSRREREKLRKACSPCSAGPARIGNGSRGHSAGRARPARSAFDSDPPTADFHGSRAGRDRSPVSGAQFERIRSSSESMIRLRSSASRAPFNGMPFTKKAGVPVTPAC